MSRKERRAAEHQARKAARKAGFPTIAPEPANAEPAAVAESPFSPDNNAFNLPENPPASAVTNSNPPKPATPATPPTPISPARLAANRANAKRSHGAVTAAGKSTSSQNRTTHGLARHNGFFQLLPSEDPHGFEALKNALAREHEPLTQTEAILVNNMAESHWLAQRAHQLQHTCFDSETGAVANEKLFSLYMRYQTTHTRAFHKCLNDLQKLRAQRRREQLGFEAQKEKQTERIRKQQTHDFQKQETQQYQNWRDPAAQADTIRLGMAAYRNDPDYARLSAEFSAKYGHKEEVAENPAA